MSAAAPVRRQTGAQTSSRRPGPRVARSAGYLWPLALYAMLSVILFGLPVIGHLGTHIIASDQVDSSAFIWLLGWWPHALLHGLNPFVTHAMFYPEGFNLTWADPMPAPSILLSPVTLTFGPTVTWNVIQLAAPALSAWTMFLLCRHVTGRLAPSLVGGYLFGFSGYMLHNLTGAPELTLVALLPVLVLLVLKRLNGTLAAKGFVIAATLTLTAQYLTSTEVLATATVFGALALVFAFLLFAERRPALLSMTRLLALSYLITIVLVSPFLFFFFFGHQYPPGLTFFPADLNSFLLPPRLVALAPGHPLVGAGTESYLGAPLVALVLLVLWQRRRARGVGLLGLCLLAAFVCSLGASLLVRGHFTGILLPWDLLGRLPVLRYAIPVRLSLYILLPAALLAAIALVRTSSEARSRLHGARWGLALLAILSIVPDVGSSAWNTAIHDPPLFQRASLRPYLDGDDHVLTVPAWGENERWVADAGFPFALADGYLGNPFPAAYTRYKIWTTLLTGRLTPDYQRALRTFLAAKSVTAIIVDQRDPGPWRQLFGSLRVRPLSIGGVWLYRLAGEAAT